MSFDAFFTADPNAVGNSENTPPPEPGFYEVALSDTGVFEAKSNSRTTLKMEWTVVGPNANGHTWTVIQQIRENNPDSANFFKRACVDLGVDVDQVRSILDLDVAVKEKLGNYYTVEVVQKGEYRNTYIKGVTNGKPSGFAVEGDIPLDTSDLERRPPVPAGSDDPASW